MAGNATNFTEDMIVQLLYRTGSPTKPAGMWHALYTAAPGEAGGGTEVVGGGYARVNLAPLDANWAATSGGNGTTSNLAAITFSTPSATWGAVTDMAQLDASTAGNMITYGPLTTPKTISNGDAAPSFAIGAVVTVVT